MCIDAAYVVKGLEQRASQVSLEASLNGDLWATLLEVISSKQLRVMANKVKSHAEEEVLLGEMGLPWSCFRPQYIYGPAQGKTYLKYFFDRVTRGRPVPVPNGGDQMVTMTHAADNAAMIAGLADALHADGIRHGMDLAAAARVAH